MVPFARRGDTPPTVTRVSARVRMRRYTGAQTQYLRQCSRADRMAPEILDVVRDVVPDQAHAFEGRGTSPRGKLAFPDSAPMTGVANRASSPTR